MKTKLLLGLALVLSGGLIGAAFWLVVKWNDSPSTAVKRAYLAANARDYARADEFLAPPVLSGMTNTASGTHRFWDYYTGTQSVVCVRIQSEKIQDPIPPVTQFATVCTKVEFGNGQSRNYVVYLGRGRENHWQILMLSEKSP